MADPVLYRDEVWTGIEYQVASALLHQGLIREGLSILRGVDDRYDGRRHNPWNEVECGDHYARALASWGCLVSLSDLVYDGPAGSLGFAPRWQANDFKVFFTGAEGWGTLRQTRGENLQTNGIEVKHGTVKLREMVFEVPKGVKQPAARLEVNGRMPSHRSTQVGRRVRITLDESLVLQSGETLSVIHTWTSPKSADR